MRFALSQNRSPISCYILQTNSILTRYHPILSQSLHFSKPTSRRSVSPKQDQQKIDY